MDNLNLMTVVSTISDVGMTMKGLATMTRTERMRLKLQEQRRRETEERLKEMIKKDKEIAEYDGLLTFDELLERRR